MQRITSLCGRLARQNQPDVVAVGNQVRVGDVFRREVERRLPHHAHGPVGSHEHTERLLCAPHRETRFLHA